MYTNSIRFCENHIWYHYRIPDYFRMLQRFKKTTKNVGCECKF